MKKKRFIYHLAATVRFSYLWIWQKQKNCVVLPIGRMKYAISCKQINKINIFVFGQFITWLPRNIFNYTFERQLVRFGFDFDWIKTVVWLLTAIFQIN